MNKSRIKKASLVLALAIFTFLFGFQLPDFLGFGMSGSHASITTLPQRIAKIGSPAISEIGKDGSLPLIATYSSVIGNIKDYYYGKVDERELNYDAIRGAMASLGDPFTRFIDPTDYKKMREENEGNFTGIGSLLSTNDDAEVYIKEPLPDTPSTKAGIKAGDVILEVDGTDVTHTDIDDVVKLIRGEEGTTVELTVRRGEDTLVIPIVREVVQFQTIKYFMADEENKIGYIRLYQFNEQSDLQFMRAFQDLEEQGMKGLIFDLRGNPGGLLNMAVEIGSDFINDGPIVIIQERGGQKSSLNVLQHKKGTKKYPLAVLIDGSSASASEIVAGAIKDNDMGTLVGKKSFGKGRVQTLIPMQDGSATAITTAKYLTPNGTDIHQKGIEPDIEVDLEEAYDPDKPETDSQLQAALDVVKVKMDVLPKSALNKYEKPKEEKADDKKDD